MIRIIFTFILLLSLPIISNAAIVEYTLYDVVFNDGEIANGTFSINDEGNSWDFNSAFDISITTSYGVNYSSLYEGPGVLGVYSAINLNSTDSFGDNILGWAISLEFDGPAGVVDAHWLTSFSHSSDDFYLSYLDEAGRYLDSGYIAPTVVPIPAAIYLFASGLLAIAGISRSRPIKKRSCGTLRKRRARPTA